MVCLRGLSLDGPRVFIAIAGTARGATDHGPRAYPDAKADAVCEVYTWRAAVRCLEAATDCHGSGHLFPFAKERSWPSASRARHRARSRFATSAPASHA